MDMGTPKEQFIGAIWLLLFIFLLGWGLDVFVTWDLHWPLASWGSRLWFLVSLAATIGIWAKVRDDE